MPPLNPDAAPFSLRAWVTARADLDQLNLMVHALSIAQRGYERLLDDAPEWNAHGGIVVDCRFLADLVRRQVRTYHLDTDRADHHRLQEPYNSTRRKV